MGELGTRTDGHWILDGGRVEFRNGCVIVPWLSGRTNLAAEEFALRMVRDTGCQVIDREHGRVIDPATLHGLPKEGVRKPFFARALQQVKGKTNRGIF